MREIFVGIGCDLLEGLYIILLDVKVSIIKQCDIDDKQNEDKGISSIKLLNLFPFVLINFFNPFLFVFQISRTQNIQECYFTQNTSLVNINKNKKMARKVKQVKPVKARRTSSIQRCVADAEDFLATSKVKKIVKTRTMARTIEEAEKIIHPRKTKPTKIARKPKKKIPARPAVPSRPAVPAVPAVLPTSVDSKIIRARSIDRSIKPSKATIFKTSSKDLPLPAFGFVDVCFCVDATGSMSGQLAQVQSTIVAIIKKIENKVRTQGITLRFAIVTYRDHPPQQSSYVTQIKDFTDANDTIQYVNTLNASGGGDEPEAAHDGLIDACQKLNWVELPGTPILRYIFHVADAPPHGKEFGTGEGKEGCLCGKTTAQVIHEINLRQIHYRLIKVRNNQRVDRMQEIFKKSISDFDSAHISAAHMMDIVISDMIIHEIMPQG